MTNNAALRAHPLVIIAATTLLLTCLLAIGIMTGIVPSPLNKARTAEEASTVTGRDADTAVSATNRENRLVAEGGPSREGAARERAAPERRAAEGSRATAPVGSTASSTSQSVAGTGPAAVCNNCGTVTSVRTVRQQGEAGLLGPAAGGLVGGAVGSQIGGGSGRTIAMIAGAAGGAAVGTEVERRYKSTTHYVVGVRLNDGTHRTFTYAAAPSYRTGDRVRIVDGRLVGG
ncbi:MAG: glycine zipper 2TM domain-containing protein [Burkholderiales bacterium]